MNYEELGCSLQIEINLGANCKLKFQDVC